jgi:hypothetical protein
MSSVNVSKLGLLYHCPPSILVEFSFDPNSQQGRPSVNSKSSNPHHAIITVDLKLTEDSQLLMKGLKERFPQFFGQRSNVSDDQLQRIVSIMIRNAKDINPSNDLFERNRISPTNIEYQYDKRKDFELPLDESSWD